MASRAHTTTVRPQDPRGGDVGPAGILMGSTDGVYGWYYYYISPLQCTYVYHIYPLYHHDVLS